MLPEDVSAALVAHPMRRLETDDMILYYPEGRQAQAARFLDRVEGCAAYEKRLAQLHNSVVDQKMLVLLPELPFNNAFASPRIFGYESLAVVPTYNTTELFTLEGGLPPDPAVIGCHEITHYVQHQQLAGFALIWNLLSGNVYSPQIGLDSWFAEGLAVYYETKLQPGVGRLAWPFWHGAFAAGMAGHRVNGGDLSVFNRDFFGGNNYLVGSEFISFLAGRYGEEKLWELIAVQGRSIFFPFGVNVRFWQVYDKSLSTLIDEFADDLEARNVVSVRPPTQRVLRPAGESARYGRALDGTEALITQDHDRPSRLVVISPGGEVLVERNLTEVLPPRALNISSPRISGQPTFTADGKALFFVALDRGATYQAARLVRYDVATDAMTIVQSDLHGVGGSISPDGTRYLFPRAAGDHHDLTELDLRTGAFRSLVVEPPGAYVAAPAFSPDGKRVAATVFDGKGFGIAVFDAQTGAAGGVLPTGNAPVHEPSWADDHRIAFVGTSATDWRFQVYLHDLADGSTVKVTQAPFLGFEPRAAGGRTVRFLNREGWGWTLDEVALPPVHQPTVPSAPPSDEPAQAQDESGPPPAAPAMEPMNVEGGASADATAPTTARPAAVSAGPPPASVLAGDRPASALDGLFVPKLYGPTITAPGRGALILGLVFSGNDRLQLHRWTVSGYYQTISQLPSFSVGYANRQLAPFTIELSASQFSFHDFPPTIEGMPAPTELSLYRRDRAAQFDVQRTFYGNPVQLGGAFIESYRPGDLAVGPYERQRFAGPYVAASYVGSESTVYTGARRLVSASSYAAAFPAAWTTAPSGFVDVRGSVGAVVPLPLLRRHTLSFHARGRALAGLGDAERLLQAGGTAGVILWQHANRADTSAAFPPLSPTQLPFVEGLRGFEDHALAVNRIFIGDLTYRYPFIIDWGAASALGILPSFFLSQIDLRLFGTGATTGTAGDRHLAVGGSLSVDFTLWVAGFSVQYQLARRVTDDRALVHLVTLGD